MSLFEWVLFFGLMVAACLGSLALFLRGLRTIRSSQEHEGGVQGAKKLYALAQMVVGAIGMVLWASITVTATWNTFQGQ
jgi:hypothetical protein